MPQDVRDGLARDPAESRLRLPGQRRAGVLAVHRARDPGGPQHRAGTGQLAGEVGAAMTADDLADLAE